MQDYKFRQSEPSFGESKRGRHRIFRRAVALALAGGALYGLFQLGLPWPGESKVSETDSNIIPLRLPPHLEPAQNADPGDPEPGSTSIPSRADLPPAETAGAGDRGPGGRLADNPLPPAVPAGG